MELLTLLLSSCYECSKQSYILIMIKDLLWVYSSYNKTPCSLLTINNDPIKINRNIVLLLTSTTQTTVQYLNTEIGISNIFFSHIYLYIIILVILSILIIFNLIITLYQLFPKIGTLCISSLAC